MNAKILLLTFMLTTSFSSIAIVGAGGPGSLICLVFDLGISCYQTHKKIEREKKRRVEGTHIKCNGCDHKEANTRHLKVGDKVTCSNCGIEAVLSKK